jgi:hypothetical protein
MWMAILSPGVKCERIGRHDAGASEEKAAIGKRILAVEVFD